MICGKIGVIGQIDTYLASGIRPRSAPKLLLVMIASTVPRLSASSISAIDSVSGLPPRSRSAEVWVRPEARIFTPLKSASVLIGLLPHSALLARLIADPSALKPAGRE